MLMYGKTILLFFLVLAPSASRSQSVMPVQKIICVPMVLMSSPRQKADSLCQDDSCRRQPATIVRQMPTARISKQATAVPRYNAFREKVRQFNLAGFVGAHVKR